MMLLKFVLVFICLLGGALFLAQGLGAPIPFVRYQGFEAVNLPTGIALLAAGILLAVFWKVGKTITTEETNIGPDGFMHKTTTTTKYSIQNVRKSTDRIEPPGPTVL
jgi:hypothetical protein